MGGATGWTGGQYSLLRALIGVLIAVREPWLIIPCAAFTVGFYDRLAAVALAGGLIALEGREAFGIIWPLAAHLVLPPAPYGSWAARGRANPAGGWKFPRAVQVGAGFAFVAWLALSGGVRGQVVLAGAVILIILLIDPAWISPKPAKAATLFYDGGCGLCHRAVRFLLAEDQTGKAFRFAPIAGRTFQALIPEEARGNLPDSVVLRTAEGMLLVRSDAMLEAARRLGGYWRVLAAVARVIPRLVRDRVYDRIAGARRRLFKEPGDNCPVISPALKKRFDP